MGSVIKKDKKFDHNQPKKGYKSWKEVKNYNLAAYLIAQKAIEDGEEHKMGMWTVKAL